MLVEVSVDGMCGVY
ncbi:mycofactocin precursor MftA [Nocardia sp. CA-135398]